MKALDDDDVSLPEGKRRELALVVDIVRAGFADAIRLRTQPRFRNGRILKIILFGSYARGDWVEDPVGRTSPITTSSSSSTMTTSPTSPSSRRRPRRTCWRS
jgi:hypothetical protein